MLFETVPCFKMYFCCRTKTLPTRIQLHGSMLWIQKNVAEREVEKNRGTSLRRSIRFQVAEEKFSSSPLNLPSHRASLVALRVSRPLTFLLICPDIEGNPSSSDISLLNSPFFVRTDSPANDRRSTSVTILSAPSPRFSLFFFIFLFYSCINIFLPQHLQVPR